jgi:hypothetical protein
MAETIAFICERCHHTSSCKGNLIKHLTKKSECPSLHSNRSRQDIVVSLTRVSTKDKTYVCEYCEKAFSTPQGRSQHKKICPKNTDKDMKNLIQDMVKRINQLEIELQMQKQENSDARTVSNTTNIQNQQNINVIINNYGNEKMPQFTPEFLNNCMLNPSKGLTNLIAKIHYNEELPENYNLRYKSTKNKTLEKFIDQRWHECDASNTLDELIKKGYRILTAYYTGLQSDEAWYNDEVKARMYEKFTFLGDKRSRDYSAVKRDLLLLVKDKTMFLLAPQGAQLNQEEINEIEKELEQKFKDNEEDMDESIL